MDEAKHMPKPPRWLKRGLLAITGLIMANHLKAQKPVKSSDMS